MRPNSRVRTGLGIQGSRYADLLVRLRARNARTRHLWHSMTRHRERLSHEIVGTARGGCLCILGAGNCNDVDLPELIEAFEEVHLVDIDGDSMTSGVQRQGLANCSRIHIHADAELTGLSWKCQQAPSKAAATTLSRQLRARASSFPGPPLPGPFDVVVSACVLSQIVCELALCFESYGKDGVELLLAVRNRHIEIAVNNTTPTGVTLLASDMVSTDTAPDIQHCPDSELALLRDRLLTERNFFHGTNPYAMINYVATRYPDIHSRLSAPWLWSLGTRAFLVNVIRFERVQRA